MSEFPKNGSVEIEGDTATLLFRRQLPHPADVVWQALTDPAQLREWYMTTAKIDGRPGGSVDMIAGPSRFHWTGRITAWEPMKVYEYEWNIDPTPEIPKGERSIVRWELAPSAGGTLLTLTHRRLSRQTAIGFAPGTHAFLDRLEALLDHARLPEWMTRYGEVKHLYPSMERTA
jgi:uncharacterized protein YndB with AHSA1/START domain